jgi:4-nitrophenyl phosphatase
VDKSYRPVAGAPEWLASLRERGHRLRILTNNTTLTAARLAERLSQAGMAVAADEVVSCQRRMVEILQERGIADCRLLGPPALAETLAAAGIAVRDGEEAGKAAALVLGYLEEPDMALLSEALSALREPDCLLVALHENRLFRNRGRLEPGLGAWVRALEYATEKRALVAGKPDPDFFRCAIASLGEAPQAIAMVGDDPHADLAPARRLGLRTVFVLSGKYEDASILARLRDEDRPHHVVDSVAALLP